MGVTGSTEQTEACSRGGLYRKGAIAKSCTASRMPRPERCEAQPGPASSERSTTMGSGVDPRWTRYDMVHQNERRFLASSGKGEAGGQPYGMGAEYR